MLEQIIIVYAWAKEKPDREKNRDRQNKVGVGGVKGIGSVYKRHPVTKFEHGSHGASKRKFNHMTVY